MPQDRTPQLSFNLSRRLISIFLVSVLAVYTAGITVTCACAAALCRTGKPPTLPRLRILPIS